MDFSILFNTIWFILPAYVANSIAIDVSAVPFLKKHSTPVDFGRSFRGKRILGDGKTWRGLIAAIIAGTVVGALQAEYGPGLSDALPAMTPLLGFLLGLGAMVGDMTASFLKRQSGFKRGAMVPLLDQLDYVFMAFFFAWIIVPVDWVMLLVACVITLPLHIFANLFAYAIKIKKVPW